MAKKEEYRLKNQQFLEEIAREEGVERLPSGVLYKVITRGESDKTPTAGKRCFGSLSRNSYQWP